MDVVVLRNAEAFLDEVKPLYKLTLNNSYRFYDQQDEQYKLWIKRGKKGNPAAKPGTSRHESGFAFDLNRLQVLTFIEWDRVILAGQKYGFRYLTGDFPGEGTEMFDWPHFEADPRGFDRTLVQAITQNRIRQEEINDCVFGTDRPQRRKTI